MNKTLSNAIIRELKVAPVIEGYSIKELADMLDVPYSTMRYTLLMKEARGEVEWTEKGKAKIYRNKKR